MKSLLSSFCLVFICFTLPGKTITVKPAQWSILQIILDASSPFDTVVFSKGYYFCNNLSVNHPLVIIGSNSPVLDGRSRGEVISVRSDSVSISGLTVLNTGHSDLNDYAGIKIYNASGCTISGNKLGNTYFGIYLANCDSCVVKDNILEGKATEEISAGNGVHLWKCTFISVTGNKIDRHRDGIYFEFVTDSDIRNNLSTNNVRYGLHFMFSDRDRYTGNIFMHNGAGVAVMYTKDILMENNIFSNNWGPAAYGLLLKDISHSTIRNNSFLKNTVGIYMEGSSHLNMSDNNYDNNGWAIKIMANCTEDTIVRNNFSGNSFDISTNGIANENIYELNYWDNYSGYDLNHDNIGDIPYRPVSLFSLIVEEIPCSVIMLRSFMIEILNKAEKTVPVFIPESIIDNKPVMSRYDAGAETNL